MYEPHRNTHKKKGCQGWSGWGVIAHLPVSPPSHTHTHTHTPIKIQNHENGPREATAWAQVVKYGPFCSKNSRKHVRREIYFENNNVSAMDTQRSKMMFFKNLTFQPKTYSRA